MVVLMNDVFASPCMSSMAKAEKAKTMISRTLPDFDTHQLLLTELGNHGTILCLPDNAKGDYELVVPHAMFNDSWFQISELFSFAFGPLGIVKQVYGMTVYRDILDDVHALGQFLSTCTSHTDSDMCRVLKHVLSSATETPE